MSWREDAKKRAALEAVKNIKDGSVIGPVSYTHLTLPTN